MGPASRAQYLLALGLLILAASGPRAGAETYPVRVVVVTTFEEGADTGDKAGEFQNWVERLPLPDTLPFPAGYHALRYNRELEVIGIVTGEGKAHAAASIMALGLDPRFDLSKAYWMLAGIGGVDPNRATVGSAAWATYIVDGDLGYEIDARQIPVGWPTGILPYDRATPFAQPAPPAKANFGEIAFRLNPDLTDWAFGLTKDVALPDNEKMAAARRLYPGQPAVARSPQVLKGDTISADRFWIGQMLNDWAERWVAYWTAGEATMVTSAEEDSGYAQALEFLAHAGRADFDRVLDLRTASDFTTPPHGTTVAQHLASEARGEYVAYGPAIEAAYLVGSPVVRELSTHWERYADHPPRAGN